MTREELIESAALDAFGLLEEYETALFTRSFHHAPAATQNEIISMQSDLVSDERLLPGVNPDPKLRERVLDAVAEAIEKETAELEPLAIIGRPRSNEADVVGAIHNGSTARYWRAAAFVLSGVVIVVSYFCVDAYRKNHELGMAFANNVTGMQLEQLIGPPIKEFIFDGAAKRVAMIAKAPGLASQAALYYRETDQSAMLVVEGLTWSSEPTYVLRAIDASGQAHQIQTFASAGHLSGVKIDLGGLASNLKNMTLQITTIQGTVLMGSA
jgi:hypothetical protein